MSDLAVGLMVGTLVAFVIGFGISVLLDKIKSRK